MEVTNEDSLKFTSCIMFYKHVSIIYFYFKKLKLLRMYFYHEKLIEILPRNVLSVKISNVFFLLTEITIAGTDTSTELSTQSYRYF